MANCVPSASFRNAQVFANQEKAWERRMWQDRRADDLHPTDCGNAEKGQMTEKVVIHGGGELSSFCLKEFEDKPNRYNSDQTTLFDSPMSDNATGSALRHRG
ncbi:hypothetical protein AVEN_216063-1 [Araneus ventricosus]|uniref:Uncharacterized protein n=1 Tax=Araneus ventricosus TaxID=182803 RepID=A0A4Y2T505_ARAVE|nr:hypothetical protein AVEN_216063-1 [Araneus ventricosus]